MRIACVMAGGRGDMDLLLHGFAMRAAARGLRLCGTVQVNSDCGAGRPCDMDVQVLPDGPVIRISQNLGRGARGCRLDPEALERAVAAAEARLSEGVDLVIVNKFGKHEAEGRGFRALIAEAVARDIPVLVGVNALNAPRLAEFVGGAPDRLAPTPEALDAWLASVGCAPALRLRGPGQSSNPGREMREDGVMSETENGITYRDACVDIDAGNALVERIKPAAAATKRPGVMSGLGGFGGLFDLRAAGFTDPVLVAATDGVGTKLRIAIDTGLVEGVGIDLVAMCVNDLICQGAEPLFFLDYFATGRLEVETAARIVEGIARGCAASGCALIGGETAEMPGMYPPGDFDLAGFAVGAMERGADLPAGVAEGDVLLGLASDGVHSNGYSLVRRIVGLSGLDWTDPCPWGEGTLGAALLVPTRLYVRPVLAALGAGGIRGLAHVTGGGLTENLPRVLPEGLGVEIDLSAWDLPGVFRWLAATGGLAESELLKTFNAGIGMVAVVDPARADDIESALGEAGERVTRIGRVVAGIGVRYVGRLL